MRNHLSLARCAVSSVPLALALLCGGCKQEAPPPAPAVHAATPVENPTPELTLLITGDEYGWMVRSPDGEHPEGGAAELLGHWTEKEKHCAGDAKECAKASTLALSTGDHAGGPAISSYFQGKPMAEAMRAMGYAASALGNNDLDFGRESLAKNIETGGFPVLAANVKAKDAAFDLKLPPRTVVERQGLKIAVVGLAFEKAAEKTMAGKFEGQEVEPYEAALLREVPAAWQAGADAVVVVVDDCPSALKDVLEKNASLKVTALGGGHCQAPYEGKAGATPLLSPGRHFQKYARVQLKFDRSKPAGERVVSAEGSVVDVTASTAKPDAQLSSLIQGWKTQLDGALGTQIGFTEKGIALGSPALGRWITDAWRDVAGADIAVVNRKGIRQGLSAGIVTKASVYSVMPWENSLMVVKLKGADLTLALANPEAVYSGVQKAGKGFKDAKGKAIDAKREYTVVTSDYLYFGGDGFAFEKLDPNPTETGMMCQTPVIQWTQKQNTSGEKPLEKTLPRG